MAHVNVNYSSKSRSQQRHAFLFVVYHNVSYYKLTTRNSIEYRIIVSSGNQTQSQKQPHPTTSTVNTSQLRFQRPTFSYFGVGKHEANVSRGAISARSNMLHTCHPLTCGAQDETQPVKAGLYHLASHTNWLNYIATHWESICFFPQPTIVTLGRNPRYLGTSLINASPQS